MNITEKLFDFINTATSPYHAIDAIRAALVAGGFTECPEGDSPLYRDGGKHFVIRDGSSIVAFSGKGDGFMITESHSDNPTYKLKGVNESLDRYARIKVEPYGGMIHYSWLDRPLSVAGRVVLRTEDGIREALFDAGRALFTVPSVAIHLNRGVNDGLKLNPAVDLIPLAGDATNGKKLAALIAEQVDARAEDIIASDLYLYNAAAPMTVGISNEFILSPRLDDLACAFASLEAFLAAEGRGESCSVLAVFNNEEVGSSTKQGANSDLLRSVLCRIAGGEARLAEMLHNSFAVSADNAHALHPNHPELSDAENAPILGKGVAIKYNANQRYTTDAVSDALLSRIAERAGVPLQKYCNRADLPGGSTLGSISNTRVALATVDIGIPQLAMHSATETCAVADVEYAKELLLAVYSASIKREGRNIKIN